jgi:hypothetical protein
MICLHAVIAIPVMSEFVISDGIGIACYARGDHHYIKELSQPNKAPPTISQVEFILNHTNKTSEMRAAVVVRGSIKEVLPNCQVTAAINPREAALTPSSKLFIHGDLRIRGMIGLEMATKMKEGRKIPRVASRAPGRPSTR